MTTLADPNRLPLIRHQGGRRDYYRLDDRGNLQHWEFTKDCWVMLTDNLFQQTLQGFDGASDKAGLFHLLGYDDKGLIYHIDSSNDMHKPQLIYANSNQKICQLSCCFDPQSQLHALYLKADGLNKMQHLYYVCCKDQKWLKPSFVDPVCGIARSYCCILTDRQSQVYMIYPILDEDRLRLSFRKLDKSQGHDRIYLFPGKQDGPYWPSYYCDAMNNIHISWINRYEGCVYLNYIQRDKTGEWRHYLQTAVPAETLPPASLFFKGKNLLIYYQWGKKLGLLYSRDGGVHWNRGKDGVIEQKGFLTRFSVNSFSDIESATGHTFFFSYNIQWEKNIDYISSTHNHNHINTQKAVGLKSPALLSRAFEHAGNSEINNDKLIQKQRAKENELTELRVQEQVRIAELENVIAEKTQKLSAAESRFKETLQTYRDYLEKEKTILLELINLLRADVIKLQSKNEKLLKDNVALEQIVIKYEKETEGEKYVKKEKDKRNLFNYLIQILKLPKR